MEHRLYDNSNSEEIGFDEFHNALEKMSEVALLLQRFKDRQEAITYLTNETGLPAEECASAYDIYMKIFEYLNNSYFYSSTTEQESPKRTSCFSYARNQKGNFNHQ